MKLRPALLALTVAAAAQAAPLDKPVLKPMPGPIGPAVPKPAANCLTIASDGSVGIGASPEGSVAITTHAHDPECPSSIVVDWTINPEAVRPTPPPPGSPNVWWRPNVPLIVHDSRTLSYGGVELWMPTLNAKTCTDYKQTQKIYRRAQNETSWTLVAEATSSSRMYESTKCLITRPNASFRAAPPPANQKVYYRTVDTFSSAPAASATAKYLHDKDSSQTE